MNGGWFQFTSAARGAIGPDHRSFYTGFRVVLNVPASSVFADPDRRLAAWLIGDRALFEIEVRKTGQRFAEVRTVQSLPDEPFRVVAIDVAEATDANLKVVADLAASRARPGSL